MSHLFKTISQEDLLRLETGTHQVEIENGAVIDHHPVSHAQPLVVENLYKPLEKFVREHHLGVVMIEGLCYQLKGTPQDIQRVYIPAVSYIKSARIPPHFDGQSTFIGSPDLAVELALHGQSSNSSLLKKLSRYIGAGTQETWLVLVHKKEVHQYFKDDFGVHVYREGDTLTSLLLPGFALTVHSIFAVKDRE